MVREVSSRLLLLGSTKRTKDRPTPPILASKQTKGKRPSGFPGPKRPGKNTKKERNQDQEYVSEKVSGDKLMSMSEEVTSSTAQMRYILKSAEERRRIQGSKIPERSAASVDPCRRRADGIGRLLRSVMNG